MHYNKVEISGVNTSKLIVLKEAEKMALLQKIKEGDKTARDKLISGNLRLEAFCRSSLDEVKTQTTFSKSGALD